MLITLIVFVRCVFSKPAITSGYTAETALVQISHTRLNTTILAVIHKYRSSFSNTNAPALSELGSESS